MNTLDISWKGKRRGYTDNIIEGINRHSIERGCSRPVDIYEHIVNLIRLDDAVGKDAVIQMAVDGIIMVRRIVQTYQGGNRKSVRDMLEHQIKDGSSYIDEYRVALDLITSSNILEE